MKFSEKIAFLRDSKRYGIPFWQHPEFLFLVLGIFICFFSFFVFSLSQRYFLSPTVSALLTCLLVAVFLIFSFLVCQIFEKFLESAKLKNEILSILSHNLKGPLTSFKWGLEFLEKNQSISNPVILEELKTRVKSLEESFGKISLLTKIDFLCLSKERFFLSQVCERVLSEKEEEIKKKNLQISFEKSQEREVVGPKKEIEFVVKNLVENAVLYSPENKKIFIKIYGNKEKIFFTIENEVSKMSPTEQKQIFKMFFRGEEAMHSVPGWGLGLYLSKLIIERSGGKIGFFAKKNRVEFWFYLKTYG